MSLSGPRARALASSVLIHAAGIALLLSIRLPEPVPVRSTHVTMVAPLHRAPAPVISTPAHSRPVRNPPRIVRTFLVPARLPQPAPPKTWIAPEPPVIRPPEILSPPLLPGALELAPPKVVKMAGFSPVQTVPPPATAARVSHPEIAVGAFGDTSVAAAPGTVPLHSHTPAPASLIAAEILSKPRPVYTEEARRLQIEGEVLLEVLFAASGEASVVRTIRGLGHGLDENAAAAARRIRFRPAERGGMAVDSTAVVRIVFQLAY